MSRFCVFRGILAVLVNFGRSSFVDTLSKMLACVASRWKVSVMVHLAIKSKKYEVRRRVIAAYVSLPSLKSQQFDDEGLNLFTGYPKLIAVFRCFAPELCIQCWVGAASP